MSILLMTQAFSAEIKSATAKIILLKLADNANDNGYCFPSIEYIAKLCSVHKRTVSRQIKNLEKLGFLEVKTRFNNNKQTSNEYLLHIASPIKPGGDISPPLEKEEPNENGASEESRGDRGSPVGVAEDHAESFDLSKHRDLTSNRSCATEIALVENKVDKIDLAFNKTWDQWENKVAKIPAKKAFKKLCKKNPKYEPDFIATSLIQNFTNRTDLNENIHLASYLNAERWNDEPIKPAEKQNKRVDPLLAAMGRV